MADKKAESDALGADAERFGQRVMQTLAKLVGCPTEGITGLRRTDDGWAVTVEVLEVERLPETTDVLASYDVEVDPDGEIVSFERRRRYLRAETEGV
jgi:Gas vesicle synthesis protein GvpO